MARPRTLDRDAILDAVEAIILEAGGQSVTLDAVVARSGASKGGIVHAFGSKEGLVRAVLERELTRFATNVASRQGGQSAAGDILRAYIEESRDETDASLRRIAVFMAAAAYSPELRRPIRDFYARHVGPLSRTDADALALQRVFFAIEGASLLRGFGLVDFDADRWDALIDSCLAEYRAIIAR